MIEKAKNRLKNDNFTFVLINGNVEFTSTERGIKPMFMALTEQAEIMQGAYIADKVIGKAAALLAGLGKVKAIYTPLASQDAIQVCKHYGIEINAEKIVPYIQNREKTGPCPMEAIAKGTENPHEIKLRVAEFIKSKGL